MKKSLSVSFLILIFVLEFSYGIRVKKEKQLPMKNDSHVLRWDEKYQQWVMENPTSEGRVWDNVTKEWITPHSVSDGPSTTTGGWENGSGPLNNSNVGGENGNGHWNNTAGWEHGGNAGWTPEGQNVWGGGQPGKWNYAGGDDGLTHEEQNVWGGGQPGAWNNAGEPNGIYGPWNSTWTNNDVWRNAPNELYGPWNNTWTNVNQEWDWNNKYGGPVGPVGPVHDGNLYRNDRDDHPHGVQRDMPLTIELDLKKGHVFENRNVRVVVTGA
jgi:hypothetical protein